MGFLGNAAARFFAGAFVDLVVSGLPGVFAGFVGRLVALALGIVAFRRLMWIGGPIVATEARLRMPESRR